MSAAVKIREKISGLTSEKDTIIKEANRNLNDLNDSNNSDGPNTKTQCY